MSALRRASREAQRDRIPRVIEVIIQKHRWKQAELERRTLLELLDDLPRAEVLLMGVRAEEVEVELVSEIVGEEVAAAGERL